MTIFLFQRRCARFRAAVCVLVFVVLLFEIFIPLEAGNPMPVLRVEPAHNAFDYSPFLEQLSLIELQLPHLPIAIT